MEKASGIFHLFSYFFHGKKKEILLIKIKGGPEGWKTRVSPVQILKLLTGFTLENPSDGNKTLENPKQAIKSWKKF